MRHGLDWRRMGAAHGIAGSIAPEQQGCFVCHDDFEVDWFVGMNNTGGPVDVWAISGVDEDSLVESPEGHDYVAAPIPPDRLKLVRTDIEPVDIELDDASAGGATGSISVTFRPGHEPDNCAIVSAVDVRIDDSLDGIDWESAKTDLAADDFDNGRTAEALRRSFQQSQHVAIARDGERVVGMARLLSDGVCNAYLLDVWTASAYRRRGIASTMIRILLQQVPGQHVGLQTDHAQSLYTSLGFRAQPEFWSTVAGSWLDNDANR